MTREKYESLPLSTLKALAKSRNMKGISTLRKEALIERMLEEDQKENQKNMEEPAVLKEEKKTETVQDQNQESNRILPSHIFRNSSLILSWQQTGDWSSATITRLCRRIFWEILTVYLRRF